MNIYRQPIIFFGFVIPLLITLILAGVGHTIKSKVQTSFKKKEAEYKGYLTNQQAARAIESQVGDKRSDMLRWNQMLSSGTAGNVSANLRKLEETFSSKEFQYTSTEYPATRSGFAAVSTQKSTQANLAFRGTFRAMQRALFELETRMPQLQLYEMSIQPDINSQSLSFDLKYTAWEQ